MITKITSLNDIDFDGLFAGSLPRMDAGTFIWPEGITSEAEKKAYMWARLEKILAQSNNLSYLHTVDGEQVAAIFGVKNGNMYAAGLSLVRPDSNGSRAFIYRQDVLDAQKAFFAEHGIEGMSGIVPKDSPLKPGLEARHATENRPLVVPISDEVYERKFIRIGGSE